tara:strand:- start:505 stop:1005 length:501 start_codon:yes stop_codon:yes gene_type:complete
MLKINFKQLITFISVGLIAVSCSDDHSAGPEEHIDAEGMILESNETEMYREFEGEVTTNNLTMAVGTTIDLSVHFLDHDGNEIEHEDEEHGDEEGEEDELSFQISDASVISAASEEHEDGDGDEEHHELGFELTGLSVGTTTFTVSLMHEGHADYTSLPITVTITE